MMEMTESPAVEGSYLNRRSPADIESSHQNNRQDRVMLYNDRYIISKSSLVLTFTSYTISTTTITSRVTLRATTAVSCLPSGITIC